MMSSLLKIAILDDYQGASEPHFKLLDPTRYEIIVFKDTLLPYNHRSTPKDAKHELVKRLAPFHIISKSQASHSTA